MNAVALRFVMIALVIIGMSLAFSYFFHKELVLKVRNSISWLLKVSFFDLVKMIIFLRPLKKYVEQIGILLWIILVFVVGRYLIVTQPQINDIPGPYIPMIGYVYYLSVLFIIWFVLKTTKRAE